MQCRGKHLLSAGVSRAALQRARVAGWVALICASAVCLGLALAIVLLAWRGDRSLPGVLSALTLPGLAPAAAAALWGLAAVILLALGVRGLLRVASSSQRPATPPSQSEPDSPLPRIVVVGGGHGLSTLLRGLKSQHAQLTAIVTMADDGGSSGKLRRETGMLPPGDARNCLVALAQAEPLMTQLFEYRFGRGAGLDGHAFGNLFIAAMAGISGSFEDAISEASRVLAVRGRVLPSTLQNVTLCGEVRGGASASNPDELRTVCGESALSEADGVIERVYLQPDDAHGYPEAIRALLEADLIILGPGSLFTSILPNLLVPDIGAAINASSAHKVYACNVATQPGETDGFDVGTHVRVLEEHLGPRFCHCVIANNNLRVTLPPGSGSTMVAPTFGKVKGYRLLLDDLVDDALPWRHDADKLAAAVMSLFERCRSEASINGDSR